MNIKTIACAFIMIGAAFFASDIEARRHRCCNGAAAGAALGFFAGAFTGAAIASSGDYYVDMPMYDIYYPGAPLFAYDYPTYVYAPMYAYPRTLYTYPGFYSAY